MKSGSAHRGERVKRVVRELGKMILDTVSEEDIVSLVSSNSRCNFSKNNGGAMTYTTIMGSIRYHPWCPFFFFFWKSATEAPDGTLDADVDPAFTMNVFIPGQ